jgi:shikimate kinase
MAAAQTRTQAQVRKDIEAEREQLAGAVEQLRGELGTAANITGKLKSKLPVVAGGAASVGFVLAGGIGATMRYLARRGRD